MIKLLQVKRFFSKMQSPQTPVRDNSAIHQPVTSQTTAQTTANSRDRWCSALYVAIFSAICPATVNKALIEGSNAKIKFAQELPSKIAQAIFHADSLNKAKETIVWDKVLPVPEKFDWVRKSVNTPAGKFYSALKANKNSLMRDLQIDSAKYTMLSDVALRIAQEESKLGESLKYKCLDGIQSVNLGRDLCSIGRKAIEGDGTLSIGLTRMKIDGFSEEEKALFDKYGITYGNNCSNIDQPDKSAIATIIHLAKLAEGYNQYLETVRAIKPDLNTFNVERAIRNAQGIIFYPDLRPNFGLQGESYKRTVLKALTSVNNSKEEKRLLKDLGLTKPDLEDLRIYATTVELSEPAYLAARWNGRRIIPTGDQKDLAVKTLLNIIAQKGYVANINKNSRIPYNRSHPERTFPNGCIR